MITHRWLIVFISGLMFGSCATLTHQRTVMVAVRTDTDSVKFCINRDTSTWYRAPMIISVERSKRDLLITAQHDSMQRQVLVRSKLSTAFWLGNLFSGGLIGYGIDLTNNKRFTYPPDITLTFKEPGQHARGYKTWLNPGKGMLSFKTGIPEGNFLYLDKGANYGNTFGFMGISGGLEYYIRKKLSVSGNAGVLTDYMLPVPLPIDYAGGYERARATYASIQAGSDIGRFHYDIGLQQHRTSYYREQIISVPNHQDTTLVYAKKQNTLGLAFSTYYKVNSLFNVGISYYPSVIAWDTRKVYPKYSHLIFLELIFRL